MRDRANSLLILTLMHKLQFVPRLLFPLSLLLNNSLSWRSPNIAEHFRSTMRNIMQVPFGVMKAITRVNVSTPGMYKRVYGNIWLERYIPYGFNNAQWISPFQIFIGSLCARPYWILLPNCLKLRSSLGRTEEKRQTVTYDSVTCYRQLYRLHRSRNSRFLTNRSLDIRFLKAGTKLSPSGWRLLSQY